MRVAVAFGVSAGLAVVLAQLAGAESRYADPAGDGSAAIDLTSVRVSNDASGQISFQVDHSNLETLSNDISVGLLIDADRSRSTGSSSLRGADYMLERLPRRLPALFRWTGSAFVGVPTRGIGWSFGTRGAILSVDRSDLGGTTAFDFWLRASSGALFGAGPADDAPDSGTWSYQLSGARPTSLSELVQRVRSGVIRIEVESCEGRRIGSGILIGPKHVVTVEHVVSEARRVVLVRNGKRLGSARVIGSDARRDLALLQATRPVSGYRFALTGRSPQVGDPVAVLGYPVGLPLSVTRGSVSGLNRSVRIDGVTRRGLLQTDAAVNRGNSGGPLLAIETGALLGLVDIGSTQVNGIAFAVGMQVAKPLLQAWRASPQPRPPARCG